MIYPNTRFILSKNAILRRHKDSYMIFMNLKKGEVEYYGHNAGYFILEGGTLHGNWSESDEAIKYGGETGAFGHLSRFELKDCTIIDGANGDHVFDICGCDNILIEGNTFLGVHGVVNPTEVIQIDLMMTGSFSAGYFDNTTTKNCVIRNNIFKPNPNNSKSKMTIPLGSHSSKDGIYYENITIENNKFYNVEGNTVSNGISLSMVDGCIIKNNLFDYTNIELKTDIIKLQIPNGTTITCNPFKNILIENNIINLTNCTGSYNALNVYVNPNEKNYWIENVNILNNDFGGMPINLTKIKNIEFKGNRNITTGNFVAVLNGTIQQSNFNYCLLDGLSDIEFKKNTIANNISSSLNGLIDIQSGKYITSNLTISNNTSEYTGTDTRKMIGFTSGLGIQNLVITHNTHTNGDLISKKDYLTHTGTLDVGYNTCSGKIVADGLVGSIHDNNCSGISATNCKIYYNTVEGGDGIGGSNVTAYNNVIEGATIAIQAGEGSIFIGNTIIDCTGADRWVRSYYVENIYYINNTFIDNAGINPKYFIEANHSTTNLKIYSSNNIYKGVPTTSYELNVKNGLFITKGLKKYLQYIDNSGSIQVTKL